MSISIPSYVPMGPAPLGSSGRFLEELNTLVDICPSLHPLLAATEGEKPALKVSLFSPIESGLEEQYFGMFVSHSDFQLEKLGEKYEICRGFPVRWVPGKSVRFFGFRPKFKNDDRQSEVTRKFDALAGFVKLSGYLSHLLTWIESDGTPCWTAFSKNSGDSTLTLEEAEAQNKKGGFANDAASIWQPYITTRLIIDMEKTYTHVCAETLSKKDACHGADPLENVPCVTTMGRGVVIRQFDGRWMVINERPKGYVTFYGFKETIKLCKDYGLPVCSAVIATGPAAEMIMERLGSGHERDYMTYLRYMALTDEVSAKYPENFVCHRGTHDHMALLGDCLEGIVWHTIKKGSNKDHLELVEMIENSVEVLVVKFKFPGYTGRTMGIREAINKGLLDNLGKFDSFISNWANWWCISTDGASYWRDFYWKIALQAKEEDHDSGNRVALHIRLCSNLQSEWEVLDAARLREVRQDVAKDRAIALMASDPILVGPCTVVVPGAKDFSDVERTIRAHNIETTTKKSMKAWTGWVRLTNTPCIPNKDSGPVYMLPLNISSPDWVRQKYENVAEFVVEVSQISDLVPAIHRTIRERNDEDAVNAHMVSPMEQKLRNEQERAIRQIENEMRKSSLKPKVFVLVGPQCSGKSGILDELKRKGHEIDHCSADIHMGAKFDWTRLQECHHLCAKSVLDAIFNGRSSVVDNTNLKAEDRTIYHEICRVLGAELIMIPLLPGDWLTSDNFDELLDALVVRAEKRQRETGKTLGDKPREVISTSITRSRANYRATRFMHSNAESSAIVLPLQCPISAEVEAWLRWFPTPTRPMGVSLEKRRTMMYRSEELLSQITQSLSVLVLLSNHREDREIHRLRTQMKRGYGEGHITLVGPTEWHKMDKSLAKKLQNPVGLSDELESQLDMVAPTYKGIGSVKDGSNEVFYLVYDWPWAKKLRESWGLMEPRDFHATVLWTGDNDIHGVSKNTDTLIY
jgi:hypothetical protein